MKSAVMLLVYFSDEFPIGINVSFIASSKDILYFQCLKHNILAAIDFIERACFDIIIY